MLGGAVLSTLAMAACASDENVVTGPEGSSTTIIAPDSGLDAGESDGAGDDVADAAPFVCAPTELCPTGPFAPNNPGGTLDLRTRINVVRGRSPSDVWAAGVHGSLAHFDGTSWTMSDVGTKETLNALWLRDSDELALVSMFSVYTRGLTAVDAGADASAPSAGGWTSVGAPPAPENFVEFFHAQTFQSAWAPSDAEWLWCATVETASGTSQPHNGLWRIHIAPATNQPEIAAAFPVGTCSVLPCQTMTSIHGASADDLWAVGYTGATVHIQNAQSDTPTMTAFDSKTWVGLEGVWAASATEAWAVGGAGVIRHWTGGAASWEIVSDVPTTETLRAVWGTSPTDIWAVGDASVVLHYDGKAWSQVTVAGTGDRRPNLYTVWTATPGHVWIGGDGVLLSLGGNP
ncbi:hypothetical protein AKJ09_09091 [Labilithrix luteola]|uniref:Type IV fimbrial biogenesis protein PilY1 n=1 Tax=Labilithrix luteola TaxID=1391654 RepID=A0A0K1Q9L9_9BACT|nr:hypothetical protein AKJ09_09091 [Labilithrix luteola]